MNRRSFIFMSSAFLASGLAAASQRLPTPASTEGPFFPDRMPVETDSDLTRIAGYAARARGTPLALTGRVLTVDGAALAGAKIEIWQSDADGRYLHSASSGERGIDPGFQGYGVAIANGDGAFQFRTIVPVPYGGRTPHIHARLVAPNGRSLTTQIYLPGHSMNDEDFVYSRLGSAAAKRAATMAETTAAEPGVKTGAVNFVLR